MDKTEVTAVGVGLGGAAASPLLGHFAIIALCALAGGLWTLSRIRNIDRLEGVKFLFRAISISVIFTGLLARYLSDKFNYPVHEFLGPIAFLLAWVGDRWLGLRDWAMDKLLKDKSK